MIKVGGICSEPTSNGRHRTTCHHLRGSHEIATASCRYRRYHAALPAARRERGRSSCGARTLYQTLEGSSSAISKLMLARKCSFCSTFRHQTFDQRVKKAFKKTFYALRTVAHFLIVLLYLYCFLSDFLGGCSTFFPLGIPTLAPLQITFSRSLFYFFSTAQTSIFCRI